MTAPVISLAAAARQRGAALERATGRRLPPAERARLRALEAMAAGAELNAARERDNARRAAMGHLTFKSWLATYDGPREGTFGDLVALFAEAYNARARALGLPDLPAEAMPPAAIAARKL